MFRLFPQFLLKVFSIINNMIPYFSSPPAHILIKSWNCLLCSTPMDRSVLLIATVDRSVIYFLPQQALAQWVRSSLLFCASMGSTTMGSHMLFCALIGSTTMGRSMLFRASVGSSYHNGYSRMIFCASMGSTTMGIDYYYFILPQWVDCYCSVVPPWVHCYCFILPPWVVQCYLVHQRDPQAL
jgi:hypothetical protein